MIVYRLCLEKYKNDLSGKGAEIAGGRWNSKGVALLYTGDNRALCTAEIAVHTPLGITPQDYYLIILDVPNVIMEVIELKELPKNWQTFIFQPSTRKFGDNFAKRNESLLLKVPSAVVQGEFNYLINPKHKYFKKMKILETKKPNP